MVSVRTRAPAASSRVVMYFPEYPNAPVTTHRSAAPLGLLTMAVRSHVVSRPTFLNNNPGPGTSDVCLTSSDAPAVERLDRVAVPGEDAALDVDRAHVARQPRAVEREPGGASQADESRRGRSCAARRSGRPARRRAGCRPAACRGPPSRRTPSRARAGRSSTTVCRIVFAEADCSIMPAPTSGRRTRLTATASARRRTPISPTLSITVATTMTFPRPRTDAPRRQIDRPEQRADAGRRHQNPERVRAAVQHLHGDHRHQHDVRHAHDADERHLGQQRPTGANEPT